jgi:hypothetical protein
VPLLAARSALLGIVDDDVERRLLATARGLLPVAWGRVKFDRLIVGGILSDDAAQLRLKMSLGAWKGGVCYASHTLLLGTFTPSPLGSQRCPFWLLHSS